MMMMMMIIIIINLVHKSLFGSQPEDGFMKKAETCCCNDF